jgi:ribosomal protein S18 acetylase RimI-like enzyme
VEQGWRIILTNISLKEVLSILGHISGCENYCDTLLGQSKDYLDNYQFFKWSESDVFGISPERNVHLYSIDADAIHSFLQYIEESKVDPQVIFSFYNNDSSIRKNFGARNLTSRPFYSLSKIPERFETINNSLEYRLANVSDQSIVNRWYESFNKEESSSWAIPDLMKDPELKLYLFFLNSEFVGAAANTLLSEDRLWIGRLWIDPEARGKGLGTSFMQKLENVALAENKTISLLVAENNKKALGLYSKLGYQIVSSNCYWY